MLCLRPLDERRKQSRPSSGAAADPPQHMALRAAV